MKFSKSALGSKDRAIWHECHLFSDVVILSLYVVAGDSRKAIVVPLLSCVSVGGAMVVFLSVLVRY